MSKCTLPLPERGSDGSSELAVGSVCLHVLGDLQAVGNNLLDPGGSG